MMQLLSRLFFIVGLFFFNIHASEDAATILYPKQKALVYESTINVVVDVDTTKVDTLKIFTHKSQVTLEMKKDKKIYCKSVFLNLGSNRIIVRLYKEGTLVDTKTTTLYMTSQIYYNYKFPPLEFQKQFFHTDKQEKACASCHDMSSNEMDGIAFINVKDSNCYTCHHQLTKEKYAHAPAVNWLCQSCHNGKSGGDNEKYKGKTKYLAPEPVFESCFRCHDKNLNTWSKKRYRHEPLDSGRCNKCHNPHSSPNLNFLRKPVDKICLGCHKDKHKIARAHGSKCAGTTLGKKCVSCHTPHASSREYFLREDYK